MFNLSHHPYFEQWIDPDSGNKQVIRFDHQNGWRDQIKFWREMIGMLTLGFGMIEVYEPS